MHNCRYQQFVNIRELKMSYNMNKNLTDKQYAQAIPISLSDSPRFTTIM